MWNFPSPPPKAKKLASFLVASCVLTHLVLKLERERRERSARGAREEGERSERSARGGREEREKREGVHTPWAKPHHTKP
jgi:hypothetical protein